ICCQLGAREHYAVARALHRHDVLDFLLTDAWILPGTLLGKVKSTLGARFHSDLVGANICASNYGSVAFEIRATVAGLRGWQRTIARNRWFQKMALARLSQIKPTDTPR